MYQSKNKSKIAPVKNRDGVVLQKKNTTGLPDNLKSGIENLSGYSMDDVNVHYNSNKPAQLQAHAYAQGTDIHLGPRQEKYLPHEAWHVVQQKQGRVKPTMQLKEHVNVNDDMDLELEADIMGDKAEGWNKKNTETLISFKQTTGQKPVQRFIELQKSPYPPYNLVPEENGEGKNGKILIYNAEKGTSGGYDWIPFDEQKWKLKTDHYRQFILDNYISSSSTRVLPLAGNDPYGELVGNGSTEVSSKTYEWLAIANQVISLIKRQFLPFGSGNVAQSLLASKSESSTRLSAFRNMHYLTETEAGNDYDLKLYFENTGSLNIHTSNSEETITHAAISAIITQGGNCLQNGQIAFALLNLLLGSGTKLTLLNPANADHAFVVIGEFSPMDKMTAALAENLVCVDAWPHVAKASLLRDSVFWDLQDCIVGYTGSAQGGGSIAGFIESVEEQRGLLENILESHGSTKNGGDRLKKRNLRDSKRIIAEHKPKIPNITDLKGVYNNMTIFNQMLPQYALNKDPQDMQRFIAMLLTFKKLNLPKDIQRQLIKFVGLTPEMGEHWAVTEEKKHLLSWWMSGGK